MMNINLFGFWLRIKFGMCNAVAKYSIQITVEPCLLLEMQTKCNIYVYYDSPEHLVDKSVHVLAKVPHCFFVVFPNA